MGYCICLLKKKSKIEYIKNWRNETKLFFFCSFYIVRAYIDINLECREEKQQQQQQQSLK